MHLKQLCDDLQNDLSICLRGRSTHLFTPQCCDTRKHSLSRSHATLGGPKQQATAELSLNLKMKSAKCTV